MRLYWKWNHLCNLLQLNHLCCTNGIVQESKLNLMSLQIASLHIFRCQNGVITPTFTDCIISTGPSLPSECVQTLFYIKNLCLGIRPNTCGSQISGPWVENLCSLFTLELLLAINQNTIPESAVVWKKITKVYSL